MPESPWNKPLPQERLIRGAERGASYDDMIFVLRNKCLTEDQKWFILKKLNPLTVNFVYENILSEQMYDWLLDDEQAYVGTLTVLNTVAAVEITPVDVLLQMTRHYYEEVRLNAVSNLLRTGKLPEQDYPLEWIEVTYSIHFDYPDEIELNRRLLLNKDTLAQW